MKTVTVSPKGQISIPKEIRTSLHIKSGDTLFFEVKDGRILLEPVINVPRSQVWFLSREVQKKIERSEEDYNKGKYRRYKSVEKLIEELRDE